MAKRKHLNANSASLEFGWGRHVAPAVILYRGSSADFRACLVLAAGTKAARAFGAGSYQD